jgi:hypothetical protein
MLQIAEHMRALDEENVQLREDTARAHAALMQARLTLSPRHLHLSMYLLCSRWADW